MQTRNWQSVYEQLLRSPDHGIPLSNPHPSSPANRVHLGDVGYTYEGQFWRIFNVLKKDEKYCGDSKPLSVRPEEIIRSSQICTPIMSGGIACTALDTEHKTYVFETSTPRGAILIPVSGCVEEHLSQSKEAEWKRYMARNLDDWPAPEVCSRRDLLLVSSRMMVSEWAIVSFEMRPRADGEKTWRFQVHVGTGVDPWDGPIALDGSEFRSAPEYRQGTDILAVLRREDTNAALSDSTSLPAHCVFLRGFRATRNRGVLGWKVEDATQRTRTPACDTKYSQGTHTLAHRQLLTPSSRLLHACCYPNLCKDKPLSSRLSLPVA